ncbi:MAG TPA: hypothetical protein VFX35_00530 [Solirubrobacterales bacterium]|nr:hypothetical protein [Solirubrobacterales bacterium]
MDLLGKPTVSVAAVLLVAVLAFALPGCGEGSNDSATAAAPLSKTQFIQHADAVCKEADQTKSRKLEQAISSGDLGGESSKQELEAVVEEVAVPLYRQVIAELASLEPPIGDKARVDKIVGSYEAILKQVEADPAPLIDKRVFKRPDEAASAYGIENCIL